MSSPSTALQTDTMTVAEVAEYLHLHPLTVRNLIRKGELPAYKVGREWRIDRAALNRWIVEQTERHFTPAR
ncbi:MAG: helix-turn-helix domain-containing protein [Anaerolineae bacterium]|nr:helix-turn-helix domain-containing protein [Anaerolineae bacterium]